MGQIEQLGGRLTGELYLRGPFLLLTYVDACQHFRICVANSRGRTYPCSTDFWTNSERIASGVLPAFDIRISTARMRHSVTSKAISVLKASSIGEACTASPSGPIRFISAPYFN